MKKNDGVKRNFAFGFTLAEILIVLMVIGIIATMTIPGLMKGVQAAQYRTAYKKAYNTIVSLCAVASVSGELPVKASYQSVGSPYTYFFTMLARNLSVKGFTHHGIGDGTIDSLDNIKHGLRYYQDSKSRVIIGDQTNYTDLEVMNPTWIITEDNFAYTVVSYNGTKVCDTKLEINSHITAEETKKHVCFTVIVDVNGLNKHPNLVEPQLAKSLANTGSLEALTGDQYYIFVGRDGATAGNTSLTLTGRLIGDVK